VRIEPTPAGPALSASDPAIEPLAFVVNAAFTGALEGLGDRVAQGGSASRGGLFALRASELDGPPPGADAWRALTGTDAGADAYVIGTEFLSQSLLVPRTVLLELLEALAKLRAAR
jgi:hypothetical protein